MAGTDEGKEVINMLGLIEEAPLLEEIAEDVGMPELEAARGNVALLFRRIVGHLNSDAFFANEDNGLAFIMAARDKLRVALQITEEDPEDDVKVEGTEEENNGIPLRDPLREFPEMPVLNVAARDPVQAISRIRELKINGTIGKPNQKGKLTYSSLMSQIKNAIRRKFEDSDICAAVIKCIDPNTPLRNLFDEIDELTIAKMIPTLQAYFQEKNATSLYQDLNNATMSGDDNELSFCMELMALRDKIYKVSLTEGGEYTKKLLQNQFQKSLYTGIKNERIRNELRAFVSSRRKTPLTDEQLLTEISEICMIDQEHQSKMDAKSKKANVSSVVDITGLNPSDRKQRPAGKSQTIPDPLITELSNMITPLRTQVCDIYGAVEKLTQGAYGIGQPQQPGVQGGHGLGQQQPRFQGPPPNNQAAPQVQPQQDTQPPQYQLQVGAAQFYPADNFALPLDGNTSLGMTHWGLPKGYRGPRGRGSWWPAVGRGAHPDLEDSYVDGYYGFDGLGRGGYHNVGGRGGNMSDSGKKGNRPKDGFFKYNPGYDNFGGFGFHGRGNGRGRSRGGRNNRGGRYGSGEKVMCPSCTAANALYCNHCKVCYDISHRASECPKRNDPNFTPKNV